MSTPMIQAAAAILLRHGDGDEPEVYLVRRSERLDFLGGFHAFAGGTTAPVDRATARPSGADPREITAVRELFEETGVLCADGSQALPATTRAELRTALLEGNDGAWSAALTAHSLALPTGALIPMGHWITPPYASMQFDARYFALWLPPGEVPEIWPGELSEGLWITPSDAITGHRRGELFISFPVLETLRVMAAHGANVTAAAREMEALGADYPHLGGELIGGVHICPVRTFTLPPATHTNCYLLGDREMVIVDPASPVEQEQERLVAYLRHLQADGTHFREIWLTHQHKDHIGGVEHLRRTLGLPVAAHALTAAALAGELEVDRHIVDGEITELELRDAPPARWEALHTPGHARGHLCFWEHRLGTLISGDNVVGMGTVIIAPPEGNMATYLDSLVRMRDRRLGFLFGAHGPPVAMAKERIQFYIDHRLARERAILAALADAALTVAEMVPRIYTDVDPMVFPLAEINVRAHLEKLLGDGAVVRDGDSFRTSA